MNRFSTVTQACVRWLWLFVSLGLMTAAAKDLFSDQDHPVRVWLFAVLFLAVVGILVARVLCVILYERASNIVWSFITTVLTAARDAVVLICVKATRSAVGKVIAGCGGIYLVATLGLWTWTYLNVAVLVASWHFLTSIPMYLTDYPKLAAAAENWIQAWLLRDLMGWMRRVVVLQRNLVGQSALHSLVFMCLVFTGGAVAWVAVENLYNFCFPKRQQGQVRVLEAGPAVERGLAAERGLATERGPGFERDPAFERARARCDLFSS